MTEFFQALPPYIQALIAGIITWLLTALGAAAVFIFKRVNDKILNSMQGFAAGIMIAASFGLYYNLPSIMVRTPHLHGYQLLSDFYWVGYLFVP